MEALWFAVRDVVTKTILELHYCKLSTICNMQHRRISANADLSTGLNYQVGSRQSDLNPEKCQYSILWNRNGGKSHIITISLPHDTFIASPAVVQHSFFSVPSQDSPVYILPTSEFFFYGGKSHIITISLPHDTFIASPAVVQRSFFSVPSQDSPVYILPTIVLNTGCVLLICACVVGGSARD